MSPRQRATGTTRSTPTMETTRRSKPVLTVFAPKAFTMLPTWFVKPNTIQILDRLIALIDVQSLGGDMASLSHSPNGIHPLFFNKTLLAHDVSPDPLFFLLHGQLDRLWAAWQARSPANARAIGGGETQDLTVYDQYPAGTAPWVHANTVIYMSNLGPDAPISDLFDTKGGFLCYEYDSFA